MKVRAVKKPKPEEASGLKIIMGNGLLSFWVNPTPLKTYPHIENEKRKEDFTFKMMESYLGEFGIRPFDEDFYDPDNASLVTLEGWAKADSSLSFNSYDEVRKHLRIDHLYENSE